MVHCLFLADAVGATPDTWRDMFLLPMPLVEKVLRTILVLCRADGRPAHQRQARAGAAQSV